MKPLVLAGRLIFGAWMLANGVNHFLLPLWSSPTGSEPLAIQLMSAFVHSGLFDIAMAIQLVTGALCVVMPVSTCALYLSLVREREPLGAALALGESATGDNVLDLLFGRPGGRTARRQVVPALLTLLAAVAFYAFLVKGRTAQWCLLVLMYPAIVLHARRLHDMGHTAWLLLLPALLLIGAFGAWLEIVSIGARLDTGVPLAALAISAGFAIWGCVGAGQPVASRSG